jgi:type IV fimbrial biogenesis protein FimT
MRPGRAVTNDPLIAVGDAAVAGITITGNTPVQRYVSYIGLGATRRASGALQMGTITLCAGDVGRQIVISRTGRPRVQQGGCT